MKEYKDDSVFDDIMDQESSTQKVLKNDIAVEASTTTTTTAAVLEDKSRDQTTIIDMDITTTQPKILSVQDILNSETGIHLVFDLLSELIPI